MINRASMARESKAARAARFSKIVDRLEAAADSIETGETRPNRVDRHVESEAYARRAQSVVDVEASGHAQRDFGLSQRGAHSKARARPTDAEVERMEVGGSRQAVGPAARDRPPREPLVARVVTIQNRRLFDALVRGVRGQIDQPRFGVQILLPGGVVLEVVVTDVREGSHVEIASAHALLHEREPALQADGEMQADTAVVERILTKTYPFSRLRGPANVLIFPNLDAANISYKLLSRVGGAEAIGPILVGMAQPVHVLQRGSDVNDIVNMAVIAAVDAQEHGRRSRA